MLDLLGFGLRLTNNCLPGKGLGFFCPLGKYPKDTKPGELADRWSRFLRRGSGGKIGRNPSKICEKNQTPRGSMRLHVDVSKNRGTPKSSHFNRVFHYKPSILGYPYFWKHPCMECLPTFTINLGHSCRSIFQSHGSYAVGDP